VSNAAGEAGGGSCNGPEAWKQSDPVPTPDYGLWSRLAERVAEAAGGKSEVRAGNVEPGAGLSKEGVVSGERKALTSERSRAGVLSGAS
jgi:hypothetical protein